MSSHSGRKHRATRVKLKKHPKIHLPPNLQTIRQALQSQPSENTRKHEKTRKSARKHEKLHVHTGIPSVTSVRFWISRSYSGFSSIMMAYARLTSYHLAQDHFRDLRAGERRHDCSATSLRVMPIRSRAHVKTVGFVQCSSFA